MYIRFRVFFFNWSKPTHRSVHNRIPTECFFIKVIREIDSDHILWQRSARKGVLRHHGPKVGVEITWLDWLAITGKLVGESGSWLPVPVASEFDQASVLEPFDDSGLLSGLFGPSTELSSFALTFFLHFDRLFWNQIFTCVCVRPRNAASSARSGKARYCVFWKRLFSSRSWKLE